MILPRLTLAAVFGFFCIAPRTLASASAIPSAEKPRLVVLTDISNEPDDEESLVRLLVYANEFDLEGLVATTSTWLRRGPREDLIRRHLAAYAQVRPHLLRHAAGFPPADQLAAATCTGQAGYGLADTGEGHDTAGSRLLTTVVDRDDPRPVWVTLWGGANTLAQALRDVRATRSADALRRFVAQVRVYSISDQDAAGPWIRREFPDLFYIVSPSRPDYQDYYRATWSGISGDRHYRNGPGHRFALVERPWLEEHVIRHHGPLGALYPPPAYIMEGDTPSFLGLIDRGLGWTDSPAYGGWGGRYVLYQPLSESRPIWTNHQGSRDTVTADNGVTDTSDPATVWRWREHFQNDFAARMDWCVAERFDQANHNPLPVLQGDRSTRVLTLPARGGTTVTLSAAGTEDPDGDRVTTTWWIYAEAGTLAGATIEPNAGATTTVHLPATTKPGTVHVILEVHDDGQPALYAYRRAILAVTP